MMNKKIEYLNYMKEDLGIDVYHKAVAKVVASQFIQMIKAKGKKIKRSDVVDWTNLKLKALGLEEVSYAFMRTLV